MSTNASKIGYYVVYPANIRKKIEAYYFCQCSEVTGSIRSNDEGNLEIEVTGEVPVLEGFLSSLTEYMGHEALLREERSPQPVLSEGVFRIG